MDYYLSHQHLPRFILHRIRGRYLILEILLTIDNTRIYDFLGALSHSSRVFAIEMHKFI